LGRCHRNRMDGSDSAKTFFINFDDLPGALYQLAIILAGAKNLELGTGRGFSGMGVKPSPT